MVGLELVIIVVRNKCNLIVRIELIALQFRLAYNICARLPLHVPTNCIHQLIIPSVADYSQMEVLNIY